MFSFLYWTLNHINIIYLRKLIHAVRYFWTFVHNYAFICYLVQAYFFIFILSFLKENLTYISQYKEQSFGISQFSLKFISFIRLHTLFTSVFQNQHFHIGFASSLYLFISLLIHKALIDLIFIKLHLGSSFWYHIITWYHSSYSRNTHTHYILFASGSKPSTLVRSISSDVGYQYSSSVATSSQVNTCVCVHS